MSATYGQWLREQRQARGWTVPEMRRRLREAAMSAGDTLPDNACLYTMIHRWEGDGSGVSERYRMHYCRALGIPVSEFGNPAVGVPPEQSEPPESPEPPAGADTALMLAEAALMLLTASVAYSRSGAAPGVIPDGIDARKASELAGRIHAMRRRLVLRR